jgi:hypothetical protein
VQAGAAGANVVAQKLIVEPSEAAAIAGNVIDATVQIVNVAHKAKQQAA